MARKFESPETNDVYEERWIHCNWNKSWTPVDTLDSCVWVQCINPPQVKTYSTKGSCKETFLADMKASGWGQLII
jgi:hypothetical protein